MRFLICFICLVLVGLWVHDHINFDNTVTLTVGLKGVHRRPAPRVKAEDSEVAAWTAERKKEARKPLRRPTAMKTTTGPNGIGYQQIDNGVQESFTPYSL